MSLTPLRLGRIGYLNVWPLFDPLTAAFPESDRVRYVSGHPSELNAALHAGEIDMAPASAFSYLERPEEFCLLPDLSICATKGPIQSVLLVSPVPREELPGYLAATGAQVLLSRASASSNALLRVLWRFAWQFPEPDFAPVDPGAAAGQEAPYVEIGDLALRHFIAPPKDRHVIDLGRAWKEFTGLRFVFALWIARREMAEEKKVVLREMVARLHGFKADLAGIARRLSESAERPSWIAPAELRGYFRAVGYDLGPAEQASLILFADMCRELGLIKAAPELVWLA